MHVMMVVNDTSFTYNLRREILEKLISDGHEMTLVCQVLSYKEELEAIGCKIIDVETKRRGTNPLSDLHLLWTYFRILKSKRPDVVLSNNIKPNIYAGIACRLLGIKRICNITGLGTAVEYPGIMQKLTTFLYKISVWNASCILFQNTENERFFRSHNMISKNTATVMLPGSGVNLETHCPQPYPVSETVNFLFAARIMQDKGIDLYLAAAKAIHDRYPNTCYHICGLCDDARYLDILKTAEESGYIRYHGERKDMISFFSKAHCIVHPSYYPEGMSNVLLEAAASARPVIATDRSGCRETVDNGVSGFVIPIKDENALIAAMDKFMQMTWDEQREMGLAGRRKMEREFDRKKVVNAVIEEIKK